MWMARLQASMAHRPDVAAAASDLAPAGVGASASSGAGARGGAGDAGSLLEISGSVRYLRRVALAALSVCIDRLASVTFVWCIAGCIAALAESTPCVCARLVAAASCC
jgi:hypothetical protein